MTRPSRLLPVLAALLLAAPPSTRASSLPFFDEHELAVLAAEISGDAAYEHIRFATRFHRPRGGTPGLMEVARYFEEQAREVGLADVRLIRQKASYPGWEAREAELWLVGERPERIAAALQTPLHLADYSHAADVTTELVDVGAGTDEADYEGIDVSGRIALAWGPAAAVYREAVVERGAAGLVLRPDPGSTQAVHYAHQIRWTRLPADPEGTGFAFVVSHAQGVELARRLREAEGPVRVRAFVDASYTDGWQVMVEGLLPGTHPEDKQVVLTGHLQEEKFSANDDASGCASTLEIARALAKLVREGRLPRPRRTLRFWWVTEIGSERQYFADHPDEAARLLVDINQDMVGANQGQDILRVQNVTRVPWSRFHFLNDVAEAVVDWLVRTNTAELAKGQAGVRQPYSEPVLAHLGSRHRYNAKMIPFHNNTDSMTFNEAPIGVPAITFTNWPDNYIHTTDDDLWNIDRTQLQRNALAAAAIAYAVARADDERIEPFAREVLARGTRRLAGAFAVALRLVGTGADSSAYRLATSQIARSVEREGRAFASLLEVAPSRRDLLESMRASVERLGAGYRRELEALARALGGGAAPAPAERSEAEGRLARWVPELAGGPALFLEARERVERVAGLHPIMAFEVDALVDGRRTGLDIYETVVAEALEAGPDYYGTVRPEAVLERLESLERAGLIRIRRDGGP